MTPRVARSSVEEFTTFVVDIRRRHVESGLSADNISEVVTYLLGDYSFMSRRHLTQVFKLFCLAAKDSCVDLPEIIIALDGCAVPASVVTSCVKGVQSLVSLASYKQGAFSTEGTMESVRESIARSREFIVSSAFDPWKGITQIGRLELVARHVSAFDVYLARKKKEAEEGLYGANRSSQRKKLSSSSSSPGATYGSFPGASPLPKSVFGFSSPAVVSKDCASSG